MCSKEDVRGDFCPVDNSGEVLEQGGACPSPPDTLAVPPQESEAFEGAGNEALAPKVNPSSPGASSAILGSNPSLSPGLESVLNFFAPRPGVGDAPPGSPVKVGVGKPDSYLERTANLGAEPEVFRHYQPSKCKLKYIVLECGCMKGYADGPKIPNRKIVPSTCMSLDCAPCGPHVGKRRAFSVLKRLLGQTLYERSQYVKKSLIYTVFTIPKAIRDKYLDKDEWQKVRKQAWTLLKESFGGLYGVEASHPRGDKDPTIFHPHLNFLWIQRPGHKPFLKVKSLRKKWSAILKVKVSNVYTQYSSKIARISDWAYYVGRTFPGNHKWTGPMRWYGKYPKDDTPVEYVCNECGCRFKLIGYVSAEDVDSWFKRGMLLGIDPPWDRDECITPLRKKRSTHADTTQKKSRSRGKTVKKRKKAD